MECRQARSLLSDFIDRELASEVASSVERHLSSCDHCREHLEELRRSREALRSHLSLTASEGFDARVLHAVDQVESLAPQRSLPDMLIDFMRPGWRQVTASVVAALVLAYVTLAAAGLGLGSPGWTSDREPVLPPQLRMVLDDPGGLLNLENGQANQDRGWLQPSREGNERMGEWLDDVCS